MTSLQRVNPRVTAIRVSSQNTLQSLAAHITQEIQQGAQKPFKEVVDVSSGDTHRSGMKPVSFVRQVLAVCLYPELLSDESLPLDVRQRAERLLEACDGGSVGSYTASSGLLHVRQSIAEFIRKRDAGVPSDARNVFISAGAQRAIMVIVKLLASGDDTHTGVLMPTPCPHTLPPLLDEVGVTPVPYRLAEERGWAVDLDELHHALKATRRQRCVPRAIYISNPGNPTGHVQDRKSIQEVIEFAAAERLLLLVDEVYQDSVLGQDFISYKRVLFEMDRKYTQTVEMVSFHSLSSACVGECGLRAGYMEVINMDADVMHFVDTMLCTDISTPVTGQLALDLMLNPPTPGDASYDTYTQEILHIRTMLSQNARRAQEQLNDLPGMSCQPAMGGIFLYPRLCLPAEFREQAEKLRVDADVLYCQRLLEEEGVFVGPGGTNSNHHHLRLCVHVPADTLDDVLSRLCSFHQRLNCVKDTNDLTQHEDKHRQSVI